MATKKTAEKVTETVSEQIHISPPNFKTGEIWIKGTAPLVIHKFSQKAILEIMEKQSAGSTANSKRKREPKDFDALFNGARHISREGWDGFPASAIRAACVKACSLVGFKMTLAKLSIFVLADGFDATEETPLVKIISGGVRRFDSMVRIGGITKTCDVCVRPKWREWGACLHIRYDADQFTASDVVNLVNRVGMQVGICEGRPGSTSSCGMGWGTFEISTKEEVMKMEADAKKAAKANKEK